MRSHLIVNGTDLTDHIVKDSYSVYREDVYDSWNDGNMLEHRIIKASKVKGKFKIVCNPDKFTIANFLTVWNSAVDQYGVITLGAYVVNTDTFEALQCYYKITPSKHIKSMGGKLYDVLEIEITQR